jgi:transcriptional regulator with XRE-family HTH domain
MISKEIEKSYRNIYSKRFTRKAFAQKINISPSALTKIEANGVITPRVMDSICRYFNFEGPWEFYEIARNIHSQ